MLLMHCGGTIYHFVFIINSHVCASFVVCQNLFPLSFWRSITRTYYRNSVGVVMVYDITSRRSFEDMLDWLHEALKVSDNTVMYILILAQQTEICIMLLLLFILMST